jgi:uncharacterized membrane protein YoaK (UPF0700 family)
VSEGFLLKISSFYATWFLSVLTVKAGAEAPKQLEEILLLEIDGVIIPSIPVIAAVLGVLMSRILTPKKGPPLSLAKNIVVTTIMLIAALLWVIEARPGTLFAFLIAIGLGFSGYSLIELMGEEIKDFIKQAFSAATGFLDRIGGKKDD